MAKKPTYEDLEQSTKKLTGEILEKKWPKEAKNCGVNRKLLTWEGWK